MTLESKNNIKRCHYKIELCKFGTMPTRPQPLNYLPGITFNTTQDLGLQ